MADGAIAGGACQARYSGGMDAKTGLVARFEPLIDSLIVGQRRGLQKYVYAASVFWCRFACSRAGCLPAAFII